MNMPNCGPQQQHHRTPRFVEVRRSEGAQTSWLCLANDEEAAVDQVYVCGGLWMIV